MKIYNNHNNHIKFTVKLITILICLFLLQKSALLTASAAIPSNASYHKILNGMQRDLNYALKNYETGTPGFIEMFREPEIPLRTIKEPRYKKGSDKIYRSSSIKKDKVAVIMVTGDLMCQKKQQWAAVEKYGRYEFDDNFTYVKKVLSSADFVVGNLETMLSESATYFGEENRVDGKPHCNAPSTFLDAVRSAGFDMVVNANNHVCDTGVKGIFETIAHLDQYKLIHTGLFTNKKEDRYKIVEIDGIKVAWLSYASMFNGKNAYYTSEGKSVLLNAYSQSRARADIQAAKAAGAEYIITYIHWGREYVNQQTDTQRTVARELANAGADYIIGSHSHCLQPYDHVKTSNGKVVPVIYSMGNFVSQMSSKKITMESMILKIKLVKNKKGKVVLKSDGYIPCKIMPSYKGNNYTCLPLTSPYNHGYETKYAKTYYPHITSVIGKKLKVLGQLSVEHLAIKQEYAKITYSGKAKKPKVTVTNGEGKVLKRDTDYTVKWSNNKKPGIAKITVEGKGLYIGTWKGTFQIMPPKIKNFKKATEGNQYVFSWKASYGADGYILYQKGPKDTSYKKIRTTSKTSIKIDAVKGPEYAGTYSIKIAAYTKTKKGKVISRKSKALSYDAV